MGVNKVQLANGDTIVDMTGANITPDTVMAGYVGFGSDGEPVLGTLVPTMHKTLSVTLRAGHWVDNMQSVDVDFATADAMVIAGGAPGDQEYLDCDVWCSDQDDGLLTFSCTYEPSEDVIANIGLLTNGTLVITYATGSTISLSDSAQRKLRGLTLYGKTIQNGTPSPDAPVPLESAGADGAITVIIGTSETDSNPQTLTAQTPNGLPGIPVSSGGNYTDENGQMWICDEIDFARGVYVQRVQNYTFDGTESNTSYVTNANWHITSPLARTDMGRNALKCSHYPSSASSATVNAGYINSSGLVVFNDKRFSSKAQLTSFLAENKPTVCYPIATPIETYLTAEQISAYAALHSNSPTTTITTDSGAGMLVRYVKE